MCFGAKRSPDPQGIHSEIASFGAHVGGNAAGRSVKAMWKKNWFGASRQARLRFAQGHDDPSTQVYPAFDRMREIVFTPAARCFRRMDRGSSRMIAHEFGIQRPHVHAHHQERLAASFAILGKRSHRILGAVISHPTTDPALQVTLRPAQTETTPLPLSANVVHLPATRSAVPDGTRAISPVGQSAPACTRRDLPPRSRCGL